MTHTLMQISKIHCTGLPLASQKHSYVTLHAEKMKGVSKKAILGCDRIQETHLILETLYICNVNPTIIDLKSGHTLLRCVFSLCYEPIVP